MPCNGIAVLNFRLQQQAEQATNELTALVRPFLKGEPKKDQRGITRMDILMPMPDGSLMPAKVAIDQLGRVTLITQAGTFEQGKELLLKWLKSLRSQQVSFSGEKFETHRHDNIAPLLAYNQAQAQR